MEPKIVKSRQTGLRPVSGGGITAEKLARSRSSGLYLEDQ